jgi:uncharacterized alkaline shock family protein YloU
MKASDKKITPAGGAKAKPLPADHSTSLEINGMGEVKIHEDVIAALVRRAAIGIDGVSRLAGSTLVDNIAEIVGSSRMQSRSISIHLAEENRVAIDVKINIKTGFKVPVIATAVQKAVIESVESITGMTVTQVNVIIQKLEDDVEESDEDGDDIAAMPS